MLVSSILALAVPSRFLGAGAATEGQFLTTAFYYMKIHAKSEQGYFHSRRNELDPVRDLFTEYILWVLCRDGHGPAHRPNFFKNWGPVCDL